jgi:hypothetical protein
LDYPGGWFHGQWSKGKDRKSEHHKNREQTCCHENGKASEPGRMEKPAQGPETALLKAMFTLSRLATIYGTVYRTTR